MFFALANKNIHLPLYMVIKKSNTRHQFDVYFKKPSGDLIKFYTCNSTYVNIFFKK